MLTLNCSRTPYVLNALPANACHSPLFGKGKPRASNAILPDRLTQEGARRVFALFGGSLIISTNTGSHCTIKFTGSDPENVKPIVTIAQKTGRGGYKTHQVLLSIRDATNLGLPQIKKIINESFKDLKI
jgi:hypothetical protein